MDKFTKIYKKNELENTNKYSIMNKIITILI